jgi:hypothetical protein
MIVILNVFLQIKGQYLCDCQRYTISVNSYIIHTLPGDFTLLFFRFLKKVGVNPVTFLN